MPPTDRSCTVMKPAANPTRALRAAEDPRPDPRPAPRRATLRRVARPFGSRAVPAGRARAQQAGDRVTRGARRRRFLAVQVLTLAGLCFGVAAIAFAAHPAFAAGCILLASCFDALDGRLARQWRVASAFGARFDSVADAISFGIAPACCVAIASGAGPGAIAAAVVYAVAVTWRLVRGRSDARGFDGLPAPAAAWCAVGATALGVPLDRVLVVATAFATASSWRYPRLEAVSAPRLLGVVAAATVASVSGVSLEVLMLVAGLAYASLPAWPRFVAARRRGRT
jgi:phosphatidylserine synthase